MWSLRSLEHASVIQKLTILEHKNGLVLSNTRVPVSGTWSILFPICPSVTSQTGEQKSIIGKTRERISMRRIFWFFISHNSFKETQQFIALLGNTGHLLIPSKIRGYLNSKETKTGRYRKFWVGNKIFRRWLVFAATDTHNLALLRISWSALFSDHQWRVAKSFWRDWTSCGYSGVTLAASIIDKGYPNFDLISTFITTIIMIIAIILIILLSLREANAKRSHIKGEYTCFSSNLWSKFSQCYCIVTRECHISPESLCRGISKFTHYFDLVAMVKLLAFWLAKHGNGCNY